MLVGLGIDMVQVRAFREQLSDTASCFVGVTFTADEVAYCEHAVSRDPGRHLAARFAAKEAALKALDAAAAAAGVTAAPVPLREIEVKRDGAGRPHLLLHGPAAALAARVGADRASVSLSHDGDYAVAVVVLERVV